MNLLFGRTGFRCFIFVVMCMTLAACQTLSLHTYAPPPNRKPQASPDAYTNYFLARRLPEGARQIPADAYAKALQQMQTMPRYSLQKQAFIEASSAKAVNAAPRWEELGPRNIAGRSRALIFDPRNESRLIMGGVSGGIWISENGGLNWATSSDNLNNINVGALAVDPITPDVIYAGTGELYRLNDRSYASMGGAGIFRSTNSAQSFHQLLSTANENFRYVSDVIVSRQNHNRIYAATNTGVWRSDNAGVSFQSVLRPIDSGGGLRYEGCSDLELLSDTSKDVLLASCSSRSTDDRYWLPNTVTPAACGDTPCPAAIFRNDDAGNAGVWNQVLSEAGMGRVSMDASRSNPNIVYAISASIVPGADRDGDGRGDYDNGLHAIFRSNDAGLTWQARVRNSSADALSTYILSHSTTFNPVRRQCGFSGNATPYSAGWYNQAIAVDPINPEVVWAGGMDLFRSDDGAQTFGKASYWWLHRESPNGVHSDVHGIRFHPTYDGSRIKTMYVLNDGGLAYSTNTNNTVRRDANAACGPSGQMVSWADANSGLGTIQFYSGVVSRDQSFWFGGAQDNGTMSNRAGSSANSWRNIYGGDGGQVAIDPRNNNVIYASSQNGDIQRSDNGGSSFTEYAGVNDNNIFIMPFVLDQNAPDRLYAGGSRVWRSDNKASTWRAVSASFGGGFGNLISAMAIAPGNPNRILVANQVGIYRNNAATSSTSNTVWQGVSPRTGWVSSLSFDPNNQNIVYATYSSFGGEHVWRSTNGGESFAPLSVINGIRLPDLPVHSLVVNPANSQHLYVGTDGGVFVSLDGGANWAIENTGFANTITEVLSYAPANGNTPANLYAFTYGRGAWRVPLNDLDAVASYQIDARASGTFYNTEQSGHGFVIEQIESNGVDQVLVAWFTYLDGKQRWLFGLGEVNGNEVRVPLSITQGANFPPNFSSANVQLQSWGELILRYQDADHIDTSWTTTYPGFNNGSLSVQRLTKPLQGNASNGGRIAACTSGAWYDPAQSGHGLYVEVLEGTPSTMLAVWYTYLNGEQRWLLGTGPVNGDRANLSVITTMGGKFPPAFNPAEVVQTDWGTMEFEALGSNSARLRWTSTVPGFGNGEMPLTRLTQLKNTECP